MYRAIKILSAIGGLSCATFITVTQLEQHYLYSTFHHAKDGKCPINNPDGFKTPSERGITYETVQLITNDNSNIYGWLMLQSASLEVPTVVYFHSHRGNRGLRMNHLEDFYKKLGYNVFIFDYRGYAESEDTTSETGIQNDTKAVMEFIKSHPKINREKVILYGRSLGGAVGIYAAANFKPVLALIIENTFLSISSLVTSNFYPFGPLLNILLQNKWASSDTISDVECPILFISGDNDELIPEWHMKNLYKNAENARFKEFLGVPNGTHNNIRKLLGDEYIDLFRDFIERSN